MTNDTPIPRVPKPWQILVLGRSKERDELCINLGIDPELPEHTVWAVIGLTLAADRPEFTGGKRRKGRPPVDRDVPYKQALHIQKLRRELDPTGEKGLSTVELIKRAKEAKAKLFAGDVNVIQVSVSRGYKKLKRLNEKFQIDAARQFKSACRSLRKRHEWLASVEDDAARLRQLNNVPGSGLLGDGWSLKMQLQARLVNPNRSLED